MTSDELSIKNLETILQLLETYKVTEFECGSLKLKLDKKPEAVKADLSFPKKTKEQEAEEDLFYSSGR